MWKNKVRFQCNDILRIGRWKEKYRVFQQVLPIMHQRLELIQTNTKDKYHFPKFSNNKLSMSKCNNWEKINKISSEKHEKYPRISLYNFPRLSWVVYQNFLKFNKKFLNISLKFSKNFLIYPKISLKRYSKSWLILFKICQIFNLN